MDWFIVALFGGLVGTGELLSRYRDAPGRSLRNLPAIFYIILNVAASVGALALIHAFDWKLGADSESTIRWTRVLVAGTGAMAFFRSALFTVRIGDRDIGVGPAGFLQTFLSAADRGVDRRGAQNRAATVSDLMKGVDYEKTFAALPPYCIGLMSNLSAEEQKALAEALTVLDRDTVEDAIKVRLLGLELMNVVGENVLRDAVESLGEEIRTKEQPVEATGT